ncbi:biogenesis of lysosome-related organelles complex 1 subunit 5-like isoform X2 [Eriocheir sinensis]|uniref:biogenesis of lysosome-related organelles complex 1 subunit 5-like isoform X2 n=1 Tax=Eriocheir sinensis TaxID=95602 RepID=UPI0021C6F15D|nr:biogenesis of lysosome-related organelles complex 1 subunit 5-like isoform X2 [Eriocheir sinensis]
MDVNEVFSRLFDHRPFLKGEIEFFKKEFEEKRGDREVEQLFRSLELITEIKEGQVEKIVNSSDDNLPRTIADIQVALHMCEDTLDTETKFSTDELLAKKRAERKLRLASVQRDVQEKLNLLEESYQEKEKAMRARFEQLESRAGCV